MDADEATEHSTDNPLEVMEERIFVLEGELKKKTERLEQLEVIISADGDQMAQLEMLERFEADWIKERELMDNEREEELRMLQEALEEALEEKTELESKMLRDASRESQLLDDFEWKLGEIERDYKKKVTEAEKATEDRVKREMAVEFQQLIDDKRDIDEKLSEIAHLKSYEAEVTQLRGLIHEQQRAIRVASRQIDQLRVNESLLKDDLNKIRVQGYTRKQQEEMEAKWEEKTQSECNRLRVELLATNEEEMLKAIRQVVREKDDQIAANKRQYECQLTTLNHQITELKKMLHQREVVMNQKLEAARTESDRELWELRRQLSKAHDSHVEVLEQLEQKHAEELEQCQLINGGSRVALEQLYDEKFQESQVQHQSQLNALQSLIEEEKQEALIALGDHYRNQLESLQEHIADLQRKHSDSDRLKQEEISRLRNTISEQAEKLKALQSSVDGFEHQRRLEAQHSKDVDSNRISSSSESSSDEDEDGQGSPSIGRGAGDGCSPSNSAAASQDNIRPCIAIDSPIPASQEDKFHYHASIDMQCQSSDYSNQICQGRQDIAMYCDDPEHLEATQIILEMHQVLADRDAELQRLTEEKRFYQLELIHWERNLALQRAGLPFTLLPDPFSTEVLRGFSAPPVTKPRIHSEMQILPSAAMYDSSRGVSYGVYSSSAVSLSSEAQLRQNQDQMISPLNCLSSNWPATQIKEQEMIALGHDLYAMQQGRPFDYSEDEDDDGNNNGFTTPL